MTEEQKKVLEELWANDQYPERGEIKFAIDPVGKDGRPDGLYEQWHSNGQLSFRCAYKNGFPEGLLQEWYESGKLKVRGKCKQGALNGFYEEWWENGLMKSRGCYKDGKKDGIWEEWHEDGRLWKGGSYKNGDPDGFLEEANGDGTKTRHLYKDGVLQSIEIVDKFSDWCGLREEMDSKEWMKAILNPPMTVEQKKVLEAQKKVLAEIRARDPYPERGEIKLFGAGLPEGDFSRWSLDGHCERWYKNGQLKESYTVDENGKKNGIYESWHQNGELERLCCYVDDKLSGHSREWWYNGQLKCSCSFEQGKLDGIYEAWDSTGDLLFSSSYCMGYYNGDFPLEGNETPKQITTDSNPTSSILSEAEEKLEKVVRHTFVEGEPSERVETDDFLETKEKKKITLKPKKKGGMKL